LIHDWIDRLRFELSITGKIYNFHIMRKSSTKLRQSSDNSQLLRFALQGALIAHKVT